jgi:hypothetical protein
MDMHTIDDVPVFAVFSGLPALRDNVRFKTCPVQGHRFTLDT